MRKKKINKIGIYKITNIINNKVYIGQSKEIKRRWLRHIRELNANKHGNRYLQRAWDKYREENFKFEIIEECSKEQLDEKEIYWIAYYDSNNYKNGYNQDSGGNSNRKLNDDVKERIGNSREYKSGEDAINSLLSHEQVFEIKRLLSENNLSKKEIANKFNVEIHVIYNIKDGKTYSNLRTPYDIKIKNMNNIDNKLLNNNLTEEDIIEIKRLIVETDISLTKIGKQFNIDEKFVSNIKQLNYFPEFGTRYNSKINIREENLIKDITLIKKELATTNKNKLKISEEFNKSRKLIGDVAKLKGYIDIAPEYNSILKEKFQGSQREKLSEKQVIEIKQLLCTLQYTIQEIATKFDVDRSIISNIRSLKIWKNTGIEYNNKLLEIFNFQLNEGILTPIEIIKSIKRELAMTDKSKSEIAKQFNKSVSSITEIAKLKLYVDIAPEYNENLNIREQKFINDVILIKKELATTNKTKLQISKETQRNRGLVTDIAKLKSYIDVASEYNDILKKKYGKSKQSA